MCDCERSAKGNVSASRCVALASARTCVDVGVCVSLFDKLDGDDCAQSTVAICQIDCAINRYLQAIDILLPLRLRSRTDDIAIFNSLPRPLPLRRRPATRTHHFFLFAGCAIERFSV